MKEARSHSAIGRVRRFAGRRRIATKSWSNFAVRICIRYSRTPRRPMSDRNTVASKRKRKRFVSPTSAFAPWCGQSDGRREIGKLRETSPSNESTDANRHFGRSMRGNRVSSSAFPFKNKRLKRAPCIPVNTRYAVHPLHRRPHKDRKNTPLSHTVRKDRLGDTDVRPCVYYSAVYLLLSLSARSRVYVCVSVCSLFANRVSRNHTHTRAHACIYLDKPP